MNKSIIDNLTDEEIKCIAERSNGVNDFYKNLGYNTWGKNTRLKIKTRLNQIGLVIPHKKPGPDLEKRALKERVLHPKATGFVGESKLVYLCALYDIHISRPMVDNYEYDFVIEKNNIFKSVQVKTISEDANGISTFSLQKTSFNKNGWTHTNYNKEISSDIYFFYNVKRDEGYLLKKDEISNATHISIRNVATKNFQTKKVKYASDYLFEERIDSIFES